MLHSRGMKYRVGRVYETAHGIILPGHCQSNLYWLTDEIRECLSSSKNLRALVTKIFNISLSKYLTRTVSLNFSFC